ncbi:MAG: hypothetical protein KAI47_21075, partial [Deltaproteobacteria bacterium]|nr:hypothetical protein [Deltaproteobacteria bacterium]
MDLRIGTTLSGYELTTALGRGSLGETFVASDAKGRNVVVKVVHGRLSLFAQVERFWKTQTTLAETANPYVAVPSDSTWTDSGRFLMVLDHLAGVDLAAAIAAGPLAPNQVLRFAGQVCLALEGAHGVDIVHGGITSHNIFLVRTADASRDQIPRVFSTRVTDFAGHILRSDEGGAAPTPSDDLRALVLVMIQALLGSTTLKFAEAKASLSQIPAGLSDILRRALADNPTTRYTRVAELREALEAWAAEEPAELKTQGPAIFATSPK